MSKLRVSESELIHNGTSAKCHFSAWPIQIDIYYKFENEITIHKKLT